MKAWHATYRLFIFFAIVYLGSVSFLSDSEFWSIALAKEFARKESYHLSVYQRPIFFGLLKIPHLFDLSNVAHLLVTRVIFSVLGILAFLQFTRIYKIIAGSRGYWWSILFLVTNTFVVTQFFRIRSDLLALLFLGLQLYWIIQPPRWVKQVWQENLLLITAGVLVFLSTPKAALFLIANSLFAFFYSPERRFHKLLFTSVVPVSAILVLSHFILIGLAKTEWLISFKNAFYIFLLGFFRLKTDAPGVYDAVFVERAVGENVIHLFVLGASLLYFAIRWRRSGLLPLEKGCLAATIWVVLLTLFYDQRLPYFLAVCIPYLMLTPILMLNQFKGRRSIFAGLIFLVAVFINGTFAHNCTSLWAGNRLQMKKLEQLEKFVTQVGPARLFDGQGLLPRGPSTLHFFAPYDSTINQKSLNYLKRNQPEVVVPTSRSLMVFDQFYEILQQHYKHVGGGVWLLKRKYEDTDFVFSSEPELWRIFGFDPDLQYQCW